ncbi:MAG TPA: hypothetical protein VF281_01915 [Candidatus Saccharimonadales bacterium]
MNTEEAQAEKDVKAVRRRIEELRTDLHLLSSDPDATLRNLLEIAEQPGWNLQLVRSLFYIQVKDPAWQAKIDDVNEGLV